jgi:amino acid adenylation domain-containing protein
MQHQGVQELFSQAAARFPEHVAIEWAGERVSYRELEERSNSVANFLIASGVSKGKIVAVLAERPTEIIASIIGTLKAGGVFVPLDPHTPAPRLATLVEHAAPDLFLSESKFFGLLEGLPAGLTAGAGVASLDAPEADAWPASGLRHLGSLLSHFNPARPSVVSSPDDLCYIYFTSGSTGRPKAIAGRLKSIDHFIRWEIKTLGIGAESRVSNLTSASFDASLRDFFVPLCAGGTVCVPDDRDTLLDPARLVEWIDGRRLNVVHCVPSLFRSIVQQELRPELFPELKYILMAGETLPPADVKRWMSVFGERVRLVNLYGPSETTMVKFFHFVRESDAERTSIPIGKPMEGAKAVIVDEAGRVCRPGQVGEIYIRTPYRSLGYYRQPELTTRAFIANPFNPRRDPDDIVYKTGDLGRVLEDGDFEIVGRKDHQIKLRGMRVEPGDIEHALREHESVKDAVVIDRENARDEKYLCAYVVLARHTPSAALREFLSARLTDYMIPSAFVGLDQLPRTPTGKVDRHALPAPESLPSELRDEFVAPRTGVEQELARIWSRILGVERVGVNDNFFELGGHSLLAPRLVAQVRTAFGRDVPLAGLFETPTVAGLAAALEEAGGEPPADMSLPEIVPDPENRGEPFPLTDVQQAYWVGRTGAFELGNVATHTYLELESKEMSVERFALAWRRLVERHDMLRAVVLPDGRQKIFADVPPYEVETLDLRGRGPEEVEARLEDIRQSMSHEVLPSDRWPLFRLRATLLDERIRFHISYDLLISDAHSNRILGREFLHFYQRPDEPLPPLELSFRDYVLGDLALRETELYKRAWDYWQKRLDALPPAPELPLAKEPGRLEHPRFAHRAVRLDRAVWSRIKQRAARAGVTPSGVVLAALGEVLGTWSRSPRFCINVTLYNRIPMHRQVNDIVGDFTSVTILEVDRTRAETFEARARRLQGQLWNDLEHRYVSGVQIIRQIQARKRGAARKALYPVVFTSTLIHDVNRTASPSLANMAEQVYRSSQTSQVWLDSVVREEDGSLWVRWNAVEDLFHEGMLDDMFAAFGGLMNSLSEEAAWQATPDLVPAAQLEQRELMNRTEAPIPGVLLQQLFDEQASLRPDQPAVVSPSRTLSYAELHRLTNRLARRLRRMGARPGRLVAVVMEKGWEQVAGVLGILKAGAAYLPIDAALPAERLRYLLENGDAEIVLTQPHLDARLEWPANVTRLSVEAEGPDESDEPVEALQTQDDLAYVIYTSGSTGSPKGAMLTQRGVVNRIADVNSRFGVTHSDRALALTALHHDLSVYDIFGVPAAGGTLVMPEAASLRDPAHWATLMNRHGVTLWNSVPAFMEMLVEHAEAAPAETLPASLRLVMLSGDWVPVTLPGRIKALSDTAKVISLGGPTETTVWDICYPVDHVDPSWKSIPYGRPMLNHRYHVLGELLEPRPVWVPGELYASGVGLAAGYWRDEEKTRERFVTHPQTGERLYRTGDVGRYLPDGNIEFVGRADFQVKIQGWRIEPGEIEAALAQHPSVRACVVAATEGASGKRLVAYVVPKSGRAHAPDGAAQARADLLDPVERLRFKLKKPGLRHEPGRSSVELIRPRLDEGELAAYVFRRSYRKFQQRPIAFEQFCEFLGVLQPVTLEGFPLLKYRYASAGGLYPVQTYLYVKPGRVEGVGAGTYYYDPLEHRLVALHSEARLTRDDYKPTNHANFEGSAFSVFLVGQYDAIRPVYGDASRDFCMIEAGLIASLLEGASVARNIGLCHVGGVNFERIRPTLDLNEGHEYLYGLVGGAIEPSQTGLAALVEESSELRAALELLEQQPATDGGDRGDAPASSNGSGPSDGPHGEGRLAGELREFLARKLPHYMIPSAFVVLDELPLSANGKVDRKALPEPGHEAEASTHAYVAPSTEAERVIAGVWREVLGVEKVGTRDNFFDLGGNSIKLIRAHVKLREAFDKDLPVVMMFQNPTVNALAQFLSRESTRPDALGEIDERVERRAARRARRPGRDDDELS